MSSVYCPPYKITATILNLVAQISEAIGSIKAGSNIAAVPNLRRGNQIKTIQASLAIEGNTLSLEQVTAVISGKRVLGLPREIQEVRNAFAAYEKLSGWSPYSIDDLLSAHALLMTGLVDEAGNFRSGGVGIRRGTEMVHVAPPASRVSGLIYDLLNWLKHTDAHQLIASCVFHYEFEFIHPFQDGNGRLGRLWQTLILSRWQPIMALLPVESVVRDRQQNYYAALNLADKTADATGFVEFMLAAIFQAIQEIQLTTEQATEQVTEQVKRLLTVMDDQAYSARELMKKLMLAHRPTFLYSYLRPALEAGLIAMTSPDSPRAGNQKYRLTSKGRQAKETGKEL